jgi:hypothetical protein
MGRLDACFTRVLNEGEAMTRKSSWRVLALGSVAAIAVVVAVGYGYAALTATDQTYTGCLQNGALTNIAVGTAPLKACPKQALAISWNQNGPQGLTGATGPTGPIGATGPKGDPGSLSDTPCTRKAGDAGTVAMYVSLEESVILSCETDNGPQTLPVNDVIAGEAAEAFIAGVRDVEIATSCQGTLIIACPNGQPLNPPATLRVTNEGRNYFRRIEGAPQYEISNVLFLKTTQPIPLGGILSGCSLNIDSANPSPNTVDQARLSWEYTQGLRDLNRIRYDAGLIGFGTEDFSLSGGILCSGVVIQAGVILDLINDALEDQGPLCGAPGPALFMRCD